MALPSLVHAALLLIFTFGAGLVVLSATGLVSELDDSDRCAIGVAAGQGVVSVLLGLLGLLSWFAHARWLIPLGGSATIAWMFAARPTRFGIPRITSRFGMILVGSMLVAGVLGAVPPVTESDSLAYPLPIAQRIALTGEWDFWPDLARSVYPLAHNFLTASLLDAGLTRTGILTGLELLLAATLLFHLARRVAPDRHASWMAIVIAFGCPAVAFLPGSAKEDLMLISMMLGGSLALYMRPSLGVAVLAGLFAGFAAGAKYNGAPVAVGILLCVPFCCGKRRPLMHGAAAIAAAALAGGLWYGVNLARFGNPVVPFADSFGSFPAAPEVASDLLGAFGYGRGWIDAVLVPFRMVKEVALFDSGRFGGRGNWLNPLIWIGVPYALCGRERISRFWPLLVIALVMFGFWFNATQVARLLLPAAVLLSVPAAEAIGRLWSRSRLFSVSLAFGLALSASIMVAVGIGRFASFVTAPERFIERHTEHYVAIRWMNENLDPRIHRVGVAPRSPYYLRIPWMNLAADYQVEILPEVSVDPARFLAELRSHGFSHLFGRPEDFEDLRGSTVRVFEDRESRLGGTSFFRIPASETVAVYRIE